MTNIGHFRAAGKLLDKVPKALIPTRLWLAPPTKMDQASAYWRKVITVLTVQVGAAYQKSRVVHYVWVTRLV